MNEQDLAEWRKEFYATLSWEDKRVLQQKHFGLYPRKRNKPRQRITIVGTGLSGIIRDMVSRINDKFLWHRLTGCNCKTCIQWGTYRRKSSAPWFDPLMDTTHRP